MVMNDNASSWVAVRMQEAIGIVQNEYTRPSAVFKPALRRNVDGWTAFYSEFMVYGDSPDEAMRNFDKLWTGKLK